MTLKGKGENLKKKRKRFSHTFTPKKISFQRAFFSNESLTRGWHEKRGGKKKVNFNEMNTQMAIYHLGNILPNILWHFHPKKENFHHA